MFEKNIKEINPKLAFVVCYYGFAGMAFCNACNRLGIKVIDIQHGVQGAYHPAYGSFFKVPEDGFNVMPSGFLNWNENDKDNINQWATKTNNIQAYITGNLTVNKFLENSELSHYYDKLIDDIFNTNKKKVLITLQTNTLPNHFIDLVNVLSDKYYFLIRMHPSTSPLDQYKLKKRVRKINTQNAEISYASKLPLYALLRNTQLHITEYSSVVIEATLFNVKSILTSEQGELYYKDYIKNGSAFYCQKHIDLKTTVINMLNNEKDESKDFKKENKNQLRNVLDTLISE